MNLIHTKIVPALKDASTWGAIAAAITAAASLPQPFNWVVAVVAVPGIILKGGVDVPVPPAE